MRRVAVGRQPIVGRDGRIRGYELLFRPDDPDEPGAPDGSGRTPYADPLGATLSVLHRAVEDIGLRSLLTGLTGYLNVEERFLATDLAALLDPSRFVIELLESTLLDPPTIARLRALRGQGFRIAYDDFAPTPGHLARLATIEEHVDVVKVDIQAADRAALAKWLVRAPWSGDRLLAEKVETAEESTWCAGLGFGLFQGFYFARPEVVEGRRAEPSRRAALELVGRIHKEVDTRELIAVFDAHPDLCIGLLRLINSAAYARSQPIASLHHAVVMLGRRRLQQWLLLLLHHRGGALHTDPVFVAAATRAFLMEALASRRGMTALEQEQAFLVGIAATMDLIMGRPLEVVVAELGLTKVLGDAILYGHGPLGELLTVCRHYERGDLDAAWGQARLLELSYDAIAAAVAETFRRTGSLIEA